MAFRSFLYIGRLCSRDDYQYLARCMGLTALSQYATKLTKRWYIIHPPGRCISLDGHAVLKPGERRDGFVTLQSVDAWWTANKPGDPCDWKKDIPDEHVSCLRDLLSLVSRGDGDDEPGVYICEVLSKSMGVAAVTNISVAV